MNVLSAILKLQNLIPGFSPAIDDHIQTHDQGQVASVFDPNFQSGSKLLALPTEVRLQIYREYLCRYPSRVHCLSLENKKVAAFVCRESYPEECQGSPSINTTDPSTSPSEVLGKQDYHPDYCICHSNIPPERNSYELYLISKNIPQDTKRPVLSPLLQTCKQVYVEASSLFYSHNTFVIHSLWTLLDIAMSINADSVRLSQIRKLEIMFSFGEKGVIPGFAHTPKRNGSDGQPTSDSNRLVKTPVDEPWHRAWEELTVNFTGLRELKVWFTVWHVDMFLDGASYLAQRSAGFNTTPNDQALGPQRKRDKSRTSDGTHEWNSPLPIWTEPITNLKSLPYLEKFDIALTANCNPKPENEAKIRALERRLEDVILQSEPKVPLHTDFPSALDLPEPWLQGHEHESRLPHTLVAQ